jgi:hypothetical protein
VRASFGPKLVLAFALALTVPLKAMQLDAAPSTASNRAPAPAAFLARHEFKVSWQSDSFGYVIPASSGDCHLQIRNVDHLGINIDAVKHLVSTKAQLRFVFNGGIYSEFPKYEALLGHYWTRVQQRLGYNVSAYAVIAVAASENCSIDALPWIEVARMR